MTPTETYSIIGGLVAVIGFFGIRELSSRDRTASELAKFKEDVGIQIAELVKRFTEDIRQVADRNSAAVENLGKSVAELGKAISDQRALFAERFVTFPDQDAVVADLRREMKDENQGTLVLFQSKLKEHRTEMDKKILEHITTCGRRN